MEASWTFVGIAIVGIFAIAYGVSKLMAWAENRGGREDA